MNLSELSEKGKTWDKHKANADKVSKYYASGGKSHLHNYAQRINNCANWLKFRLVPDDNGSISLELSDARFCRVRYCSVCQWRRSLMWKAKAYKIMPKVVAEYPKYRWIFITLTIKNCKIEELRTTLNWLNRSFKRLTELKVWVAKGWIKSVEVTKGRERLSAHPHLHVLAMVPPSYFSHHYISHSRWIELWQKCLRVDYQPVVHVRAIAKDKNPNVIVPEILKYQVKESDLVVDRTWFLELTRQLHNTRAIALGGVLRGYMRELNLETWEKLASNYQKSDRTEEENLYCVWKHQGDKYKIKG